MESDYSTSRFQNELAEKLWDITMDSGQDETIGTTEMPIGWNAGFKRNPDATDGLIGPYIVTGTDQGFVYVHDYAGNTNAYNAEIARLREAEAEWDEKNDPEFPRV